MECNWAKQKAMTDAEDEYREREDWDHLMECPACGEIFAEDQFEDGNCPECIKRRDAAEAMHDAKKDSMEWT